MRRYLPILLELVALGSLMVSGATLLAVITAPERQGQESPRVSSDAPAARDDVPRAGTGEEPEREASSRSVASISAVFRKPPPVPMGVAAPAPPPQDPPPEPQPRVRAELLYVGSIRRDGKTQYFFKDPRTNSVFDLGVGQTIRGWTLESVEEERYLLQRKGESYYVSEEQE